MHTTLAHTTSSSSLVSELEERLTPTQELQLARAWREQGDIEARNRLIVSNVRLVRSIARSLDKKGVALDDLVAEGNVGLVRAADRFDFAAGCRFSTFAFPYIRHAMTALFAANSSRGRLKHSARRIVSRWSQAVTSLTTSNGVAPDDTQVAEYLEWTLTEVARARRLHDSTSTQARDSVLQSDAMERQDEMSASHISSEDDEAQRESVQRLLGVLSPRERQAIEMMYGFGGLERMDARRTAGAMGCSVQEVFRLKSLAHAKLRQHRHMAESMAA